MSNEHREMDDNPRNSNDDSGEVVNIEILDLFDRIWKGWKVILIVVAVFLGFALFHTRFGPTEYEAESVSIQESDAAGSSVSIGGGGNLLQLLGGSSITNSSSLPAAATGESPPPLFLYPSIVSSNEFQYELIHKEISFQHLGETMTIYEYFSDHYEGSFRDKVYTFISDYTIKLPFTLYKHLRSLMSSFADLFRRDDTDNSGNVNTARFAEEDDRLVGYTDRELSVMANMRLRIMLDIESGLIVVTTRLPDPRAAALINAELLEQMEEHLVNYRVTKARRHLEFMEDMYDDALAHYDSASHALAEYQDSNINLTSESAQTELQFLQIFMNIQEQIFRTYVQERERARLNVQKETPIFQVMDKPLIPTTPAAGYGDLLIVFSIILGLFVGVFWILVKDKFRSLVADYRSNRRRSGKIDA